MAAAERARERARAVLDEAAHPAAPSEMPLRAFMTEQPLA